MRLDRAGGKEACAIVSLKALCGSAVMRHTVDDGDEFREWGTVILPGFRRFLSTICFFVVRVSHIGSSLSAEASSSEPLS